MSQEVDVKKFESEMLKAAVTAINVVQPGIIMVKHLCKGGLIETVIGGFPVEVQSAILKSEAGFTAKVKDGEVIFQSCNVRRAFPIEEIIGFSTVGATAIDSLAKNNGVVVGGIASDSHGYSRLFFDKDLMSKYKPAKKVKRRAK